MARMAKSKAEDNNETENTEKHITPETQKKIDSLIGMKKSISSEQEIYKEELTAIAESLGIKGGVLSRRIDLIIKEEEKGGEVKSKENDLDFVEQYFTVKSNPK